jgi:hypothetical protein
VLLYFINDLGDVWLPEVNRYSCLFTSLYFIFWLPYDTMIFIFANNGNNDDWKNMVESKCLCDFIRNDIVIIFFLFEI